MLRPLVPLLAVAMVAGCSQPAALEVERPWVRLSAVPRGPAAAYFTLHGGAADATLISVVSDVSIRAEMHETMTAGRMTSMAPIATVAVPAGGTVEFKPGGRHVMLFDVNPGIKPGSNVLLTLTFADGTRLQRKAQTVAAGTGGPE